MLLVREIEIMDRVWGKTLVVVARELSPTDINIRYHLPALVQFMLFYVVSASNFDSRTRMCTVEGNI